MKKLIMFLSIVALSLMTITLASADMNNTANAGALSGSNSTAIDNSTQSAVIEEGAFQDNRTYEGSINQATKTKRYFAPAGEINYPGAPGRFDAAPERFGYMNVLRIKDLLEYNEDGLTTAMQMTLLKEKSGGKNVMVRSLYGEVRKEDRLDLDAPMAVVYKKQDSMRSLGTITVLSDSTGAISPDVFAKVQVEAWKLGGTLMHIKAEGFQREMRNEGKGIGFSWTGSTISGGQTSAATGVLGFGASWGQAGYYDHPFIVVHVLITNMLIPAE